MNLALSGILYSVTVGDICLQRNASRLFRLSLMVL